MSGVAIVQLWSQRPARLMRCVPYFQADFGEMSHFVSPGTRDFEHAQALG